VYSTIANADALPLRHAIVANERLLARVIARLASGRRLNTGGDDPAGLIASERLAAQVRVHEVEARALARAEARAAVAAGNASELNSLYGELGRLVVAGANEAGLSASEREALQMQIDDTVRSIDRVSGAARRSIERLAMPDDGQVELTSLLRDARVAASRLATGGSADLAGGNFSTAAKAVSRAGSDMATLLGRIGAYQSYVLATRSRSNAVALERVTAGLAELVDTDYAAETSRFARASVRLAASRRALALNNARSADVLDLFA